MRERTAGHLFVASPAGDGPFPLAITPAWFLHFVGLCQRFALRILFVQGAALSMSPLPPRNYFAQDDVLLSICTRRFFLIGPFDFYVNVIQIGTLTARGR